jgi:hypothetical protein
MVQTETKEIPVILEQMEIQEETVRHAVVVVFGKGSLFGKGRRNIASSVVR